MPYVAIKSLPLVRNIDVSTLLKGIAEDLSQATQTDLRHIHVTWEYLQPEHYARGLSTPAQQPLSEHPILVDCLAPDFHSQDMVERMLQTIASSIAERAQFPYGNIFVNARSARSGYVFDEGEIVRW